MNPAEIVKEEFKKQMENCMDMMATAPDFACCLISLLATRDAINSIVRTTADAIKAAYPNLADDL